MKTKTCKDCGDPFPVVEPGDDQKAAAGALVEFGIVGAKLQALSRSGLTGKEIRRICRKVSESGGRAGAMIFH